MSTNRCLPPARPVKRASEAAFSQVAAEPPRGHNGLIWPLEIEPGRTVLVHRRADIPPPPAFVFLPFYSSSPLPGSRCESVDQLPASERVSRRGTVDVAPCLAVEGSSERVSEVVLEPLIVERVSPLRGLPRGLNAVPAHRPPRVVRANESGKRRRASSPRGVIKVALAELNAAFAEEQSDARTG